jgi:hypothetical protein
MSQRGREATHCAQKCRDASTGSKSSKLNQWSVIASPQQVQRGAARSQLAHSRSLPA